MPTAVVTGASAGIGAEFCHQLAARGNDLVLVARDRGRLEAVAQRLRDAHGVQVEVLPADLSDRAQIENVAQRLADPARPVDLLVNNAGYGLRRGFLQNDIADEEAMMTVLTTAPMILTHAAVRAMQQRGQGAVVNVASVAGFIATGTYSAAKAYLITFSESLAAALAGTGVKVSVLCPGFVRSEFHERAGISGHNIPNAMWLEPDRLVREALADLDRGRTISVPGPQYKAIVGALQILPRSLRSRRSLVGRHRPNA